MRTYAQYDVAQQPVEAELKKRVHRSPPGEFTMSAQLAASRLDAALVQGDKMLFMDTLVEVIRARGGFSATARDAGLNRSALYKAVSEHGNPFLSTLVTLLPAVGLRLSVVPLDSSEGLDSGVSKKAIEQTDSGDLGNDS